MAWNRLLDSLSRNMAFFPPAPPSYLLESHGDGARELYIKPMQPGLKKVVRAEVVQLPVGRGRAQSTIVAAFVPAPAPAGEPVRWTLLHSHGNATDLGQMMPTYEALARALRVNVMGYDYTGYGQSSGLPGASAALESIQAVYQCLLERFGTRPADVVLYGQSVGSGPTAWLAARHPGVAGVVLHSPFLSGVRVLRASLRAWPAALDIFPNIKYVPRIAAPTLVMHGTKDEIIDVEHGRQLHALCQRPSEPLWAEGAGHQDLQAHPLFVPTLRRFLLECFGEAYGRQLPGPGNTKP